MNRNTIYFKLRDAADMANVIEAAETGYIALNDDSIRNLDRILFGMIDDIREIQAEKVSQQKQKAASAATLATNEDTINH